MYVLKDTKCKCGGFIEVLGYKDKDKNGKNVTLVDVGSCIDCGKVEILPPEDFHGFVHQHCMKKEGI